jgi:hypothetical protein
MSLKPMYVWDGTSWVQVGDASAPQTTIDIAQSAPEGPITGSIWYDDDAGGLFVYDGSYWVNISGPQGPAGASVDFSLYATTNYVDTQISNFNSETYLIKSEAYTAVSGDVIFVNTASGAYTVTLPISGTLGDKVKIADLANNAAVNNITVGRNSNNIDGISSNFTIDINNAAVEFIYTNATYGWRAING